MHKKIPVRFSAGIFFKYSAAPMLRADIMAAGACRNEEKTMTSNYRNIGSIISVFGVKGELIVHHHLGKKTSLKGLEVVFIEEKKDEMLPYFIEATKIKDQEEIYIKLEEINTKEQAKKLLHKEVWLNDAVFRQYAGKSAPISLVGYHVIDGGKDLGEILEVIEQPQQVLCRLELQQKEVLIPINQETLEKTDQKNKKIFMNLPAGLLAIYLGGE